MQPGHGAPGPRSVPEEEPARRQRRWRWRAAAVPASAAVAVAEPRTALAAVAAAGARRRRQGSAPPRARALWQAASLFLVGFDQEPVGVARIDVAAEGPAVAGLNRVAHRAGDDFAVRIARDRGDVSLKPDG